MCLIQELIWYVWTSVTARVGYYSLVYWHNLIIWLKWSYASFRQGTFVLVTSISKVWSTSVFRLQSVTSLTQCLLHLGQTILINSMIKKDHLGVEVTRVIPVLPACAAVDLMIISGAALKRSYLSLVEMLLGNRTCLHTFINRISALRSGFLSSTFIMWLSALLHVTMQEDWAWLSLYSPYWQELRAKRGSCI